MTTPEDAPEVVEPPADEVETVDETPSDESQLVFGIDLGTGSTTATIAEAASKTNLIHDEAYSKEVDPNPL